MSAASSPARRKAASSSGRESGLRPGDAKAARTSPTSSSSRRGRAPRGGRGPSISVSSCSWTSTRHGTPAWRHLGRAEGARRLRREQEPEPGRSVDEVAAASCRVSSTIGAQVLGGVVDREEGRVGRRGRPEPVPVLGLLALQQSSVDCRGPAQEPAAQAQVVAALDPDPGGQQGWVPPGGVVPHPARPVGLTPAHVRRQLADIHHALHVAVDGQHAVPRQSRERDPVGHGVGWGRSTFSIALPLASSSTSLSR